MELTVKNTVIRLWQGDITTLEVDAIVNAANNHLAHGGGVAGAIVRKGGRIIQQESNEWVQAHGTVPTGSAAITTAGSLPSNHVIHAVGPRMGEGDEDAKLKHATLNSLKLADEHRLISIAFPAISTGIFGYPVDRCATIMLETAATYANGETGVNTILFALFDQRTFDTFAKELKNYETRN